MNYLSFNEIIENVLEENSLVLMARNIVSILNKSTIQDIKENKIEPLVDKLTDILKFLSSDEESKQIVREIKNNNDIVYKAILDSLKKKGLI
jgi:phosphopantetheine adenylyltransferase